jgi:hypothetical protein
VALTPEQRKALASGATLHLEGLTSKKSGQKCASDVRWSVQEKRVVHSNVTPIAPLKKENVPKVRPRL